jgi:CelD/BcsL family acetyltransferase involved in cellulose biosynthesis
MRIKEINNYSDFLALKETWEELLRRCDGHTIFSTWEWLSACWKHFGNGVRLLILLVEDEDNIVGIAPLMYSVHEMFGLRRGTIEFIGTGASDYCNFILAEKAGECIDLFIKYLENIAEKWDCVKLTDVPENAECLPYLRKFSKVLKRIHECPYVLLPESYEKFLMNLSRNQRKNIYRTSRRAEETFKVEFTDYSEPQTFYEGMQYLFDLHQKRWRSRGLPGIFADERARAFNLDIANLFSERRWLCLFLMRLSGKPVAAAYGFKYQSEFYEYISGFDPMYHKYNVGNLLRAHMISKLVQEGIVKFDFMRGAEEYKDRWNTMSRWNYEAILTRKGFLADMKYWLYKEYWRQGNWLKYLLKKPPQDL